MTEEPDLLVIAKKLRYDLTAMQGKVSELIRGIAALNLPVEEHRCPNCLLVLGGPLSLAEHVYTSHQGPVPPHWERAEELADA